MRPSDLVIGRIYFGISYEDDEFSRPIVGSYEYLGLEVDGATHDRQHSFRFLGSEDRLQLLDHQIGHVVLDVAGVISELTHCKKENK